MFTVVQTTGPECPLPKEYDVKGSAVAKVDQNNASEPLLLFSEAILKLFQEGSAGDHLFGLLAAESYLEGSVKGHLLEPHSGLTWGVS